VSTISDRVTTDEGTHYAVLPVTGPAEPFCALDDVWRAPARWDRDIGAVLWVLAEHVGASQTQLGSAVGLNEGYVGPGHGRLEGHLVDVLEGHRRSYSR
jgi:hypothetical protein